MLREAPLPSGEDVRRAGEGRTKSALRTPLTTPPLSPEWERGFKTVSRHETGKEGEGSDPSSKLSLSPGSIVHFKSS